MESYPIQVKLMLAGSLPTPCHRLRVVVPEPDDEGKIMIEVFSLVDPDQMCAQVLTPFEQYLDLDLTNLLDGSFSVFINGEFTGAFNYPGG
jgi:hypothetical protein